MPADKPNFDLLMSLSADTMLRLLDNPQIDPTVADIPDLAFTHAARLLDINHRFVASATQRTKNSTAVKH